MSIARTVFETTIDDPALLSGPIIVNGGAGHVVYKRANVVGHRVGDQLPQ